MSSLRKGDKVRVTYEAEYRRNEAGEEVVAVDYAVYHVPANATVELIEDLRPGDVYRDPGGYLLIYSPEQNVHPDRGAPIGWYVREDDGSVRRIIDSVIQRPLTLLVRDGQPVTS